MKRALDGFLLFTLSPTIDLSRQRVGKETATATGLWWAGRNIDCSD